MFISSTSSWQYMAVQNKLRIISKGVKKFQEKNATHLPANKKINHKFPSVSTHGISFFGETQVGTSTKLHFSCRGATKWVKKRFNSQASSSFSKASSNASITCSDGSSRSGQGEFNTSKNKGKVLITGSSAPSDFHRWALGRALFFKKKTAS